MGTMRTPREITGDIIARLDMLSELKALGVEVVGEPRASGMVSCRAVGREDRKPSAFCNLKTGYFGDSGGESTAAYTCSIFDLAVRVGKFSDWKEARRYYANKAGVELEREKKTDKNDWRDKLELQPWETPGNDVLALRWCLQVKRGVTVEAIKAAGGTLAYYPCYRDKTSGERKRARDCRQVIAIPAYGEWGLAADPVAWVIWDITGAEFDTTPKDYPKDQPRLKAKMLSVGPTRGATLGLAGLMVLSDPEQRAAVELVWKCEGPADMLALWAAISAEQRSRHVVVTNGGGATADVLPHQAKLLAGLRVAVPGDCDEAGQVGAAKWAMALDGLATETKIVRLGWPTLPKKGQDVRDYLTGLPLPGEQPPAEDQQASRTYSALLALADATPPWARPAASAATDTSAPATDDQSSAKTSTTEQDINTSEDRLIAKALEIDVLGRTPSGDIEVYSEFRKETVKITNVSKLKYTDLVLNFSTPVYRVALKTTADEVPGMYSVADIRDALAHLASYRTLGDETKLGVGCWPCKEIVNGKEQDDLSAIVLVNSHEAAHYNGVFERITHPRHRGNLLAFETGMRPWYDFDQLGENLRRAEADSEFRGGTLMEIVHLFERWRWRGIHDPLIAAGLVFATWVQSMWAWRPRIDVLGASNTGKSMLCSALAGIFQGLCLMTSDTTAAGLRQRTANRMLALIVDEVDAKNKAKMARQREILEMIRSASRGTASLRGSGSQKAVEFTLRHIVWVAGITLSYDDQADRNRAIMLNLLPPLPENAGRLIVPSASELASMGQRSLAVALWAIKRARPLAVRLKDVKVPEADSRLVESYAVPAAMITAILGMDDKAAEGHLADMLNHAKTDIPVESDESNLVAEILRAKVRMGVGHCLTVGQAIETILDVKANYRDEWRKVLESHGIKIGIFGSNSSDSSATGIPKELENKQAVIMNYQTVRTSLLKGTRWDEQPIDQILRRLPKCVSSMRRVGGVKGRVAMLPLADIMKDHMGTYDKEPEEEFT